MLHVNVGGGRVGEVLDIIKMTLSTLGHQLIDHPTHINFLKIHLNLNIAPP